MERTNIKSNIISLFRLIRWKNLLFIPLTILLMEKMIVVPILNKAQYYEQLSNLTIILLIISTTLIAAAGYIINDYFDIKIDNINRPDKLIISRDISKNRAIIYYHIFNSIGIIIGLLTAFLCKSISLGIIYIFIPGLLWFYSSSYKRQFILGNLIISLLTAFVPFIVAIANYDYLSYKFGELISYTNISTDIYRWITYFSSMAFILTFIREIIKDMEDREGDMEYECHTIPIVLGDKKAKIITIILIILTIVFTLFFTYYLQNKYTLQRGIIIKYLIFGIVIPLLLEIYLVISAKIKSNYSYAQQLMKFIMLVGVLFSVVINLLITFN